MSLLTFVLSLPGLIPHGWWADRRLAQRTGKHSSCGVICIYITPILKDLHWFVKKSVSKQVASLPFLEHLARFHVAVPTLWNLLLRSIKILKILIQFLCNYITLLLCKLAVVAPWYSLSSLSLNIILLSISCEKRGLSLHFETPPAAKKCTTSPFVQS